MRRKKSLDFGIGMLLFLTYTVTDRFITSLSDWIAIPWILLALAFMMIGWLKLKNSEAVKKKRMR